MTQSKLIKQDTPTVSRRDFLRQLAGGAALLAGGGLNALARRDGKKLGVALLGLGRYATGELGPALRLTKNCSLAGVVTGSPEKAAKWAADYKLSDKNIYNYDNFERIADNPDIDIVYVVTPPGLHDDFTIRAAQAGKHVISEKPMAVSVADCDRMIEACRKAKVQLGIGYRLHHDPYHLEMARIAQKQELGRFMRMKGRFAWVMREKEHRTDKLLGGGGPLMDLGIYIVHAACLAANSAPVAVTAQELPKKKPDLFQEVEESIRWTLEFPHGATCEGYASFNDNANEFRLEGAKGWMDFKNQAFSYRGIACETSRGPLNFPIINQQAAQMDDFADCARTGRKTSAPGELGRRDLAIITAIYEAARTGKRVKLGVS